MSVDSTRFWNRHARRYAKAAIRDMEGYERTVERTRALICGAGQVLEIGCGTGTTALRLAPHVGHYAATDIAPEMVAIAREKAAAQGIGNLRFDVAAAEHVPAAPGSCDAVLVFNALHLLDDAPAALRGMRAALKPGGWLISKTPLLQEMNLFIRAAVPVMQAIRLAPAVTYFSAARLEGLLRDAGFTLVETSRHGSGAKDLRLFIVARKPE